MFPFDTFLPEPQQTAEVSCPFFLPFLRACENDLIALKSEEKTHFNEYITVNPACIILIFIPVWSSNIIFFFYEGRSHEGEGPWALKSHNSVLQVLELTRVGSLSCFLAKAGEGPSQQNIPWGYVRDIVHQLWKSTNLFLEKALSVQICRANSLPG